MYLNPTSYSISISMQLVVICILGETTRAPFDLVESESELVAGFNTEYPTVYFSLFFMAEYSNIIALSEVASISFYCS